LDFYSASSLKQQSVDKHVPTKEMYRKNNQLPYMNRELRKAIYNKKMYYSKFLKDKSSKNYGFPELSLFTATGASFLEIIIFRFSF
jgi:hypothetical protein